MKHIRVLFAVALALGLMGVASAQGKGPTKDLVLKGDAKCTTCHDEADKPKVLDIGRTKHGTIADSRVGTCTACHGESKQHIAEAEGGSKTPAAPDVGFGKHSKTPMTARSETCLTCHQGGNRTHWQASTHANRDTACSSCHQVHTSHDQARDKFGQSDVCFACHKEQRSQINKPWHHPIPEGKMGCSDCHNVHGEAERKTPNSDCAAILERS